MDTAQFEKELAQSKKIEALFRRHPKFPFLALGTNVDEWVLFWLFWLYMVKPYVRFFGVEEWKEHSGRYTTIRNPTDENEIPYPALNFYGLNSKRWFQISAVGFFEDKYNDDHFQVNAGTDDWFAEVYEDSSYQLYFLGMGVDLRHPESLEKARDFMHAFFIEKLPLEEMEKKIERFDRDEGHKFKRGAKFVPVKGGSGDYGSVVSSAALPKPIAAVGAPCPATGMWFCAGVSPESGIYLRKGDPMPGQSYSQEQQETMEWRLIKPLENT